MKLTPQEDSETMEDRKAIFGDPHLSQVEMHDLSPRDTLGWIELGIIAGLVGLVVVIARIGG